LIVVVAGIPFAQAGTTNNLRAVQVGGPQMNPPAQKLINVTMPQIFGFVVAAHLPMITFQAAMASLLSFLLRHRASLELEVIALRHQLSVLKRQRPGRARMSQIVSDRSSACLKQAISHAKRCMSSVFADTKVGPIYWLSACADRINDNISSISQHQKGPTRKKHVSPITSLLFR
jgi:hypothetical protein